MRGAKYGEGPLLIAEADESDRSFLRYRPRIAVVTSIEPDHLENYNGSFAELKKGYAQHLDNVKPGGWAVVCADDPASGRWSPAWTRANAALSGTDWMREPFSAVVISRL